MEVGSMRPVHASYPVANSHFDDIDQMDMLDVLTEMDALNHESVPDSNSGSVIRRYERLIAKFESFFGRMTDVQCDIKDGLLKRIEHAYDGQKSALDRKAWGTVCFQAFGGVAGLAGGALPDGAWKNMMQIGFNVLPKVGEVIGTMCDASSVAHQKEQQLANATMTSEDTRLNSLQRIRDTYQAARQRLDELKSRGNVG